MPVTILDIARKLSLSHATVSYVLNNRGNVRVSQATRERVLDAAKEMGYHPNQAARALVTGRTHTVALWIVDGFSPYYSLVARHIHRQANLHDYYALIHDAEMTPERVSDDPRMHWTVDGILAVDLAMNHRPRLMQLQTKKIPLVSFGCYCDETMDRVSVDLYAGAVEAVRHLLASGRKRVALMINHGSLIRHDIRSDAYEAVMREAGLEPEYILLSLQYRKYARARVIDYVGEYGRPEAIFCVNDEVAAGCSRGLQELGLRIPDDVAIVGCDGMEETEYYTPSISTIALPAEEMCRLAWEMLERRMNEPDAPVQEVVLQPSLLIRESSRV